jgi:hypothetical protein
MPENWFYMKGADKHGPVTSTKLRELAESGQLLPTDLVWREGMGDWKRARKIDGLFEATGSKAVSATAPKPASPERPKKRPPPPPGNLLGSSEVQKRPHAPPGNSTSNAASTSFTKPATSSRQPAPAQTRATSSEQVTSVSLPPLASTAGADGVFRCPHCRQEMSNDPAMAGGEVVGCPHCAKEFRMPAVPGSLPTGWPVTANRKTAGRRPQAIVFAGIGLFSTGLTLYLLFGASARNRPAKIAPSSTSTTAAPAKSESPAPEPEPVPVEQPIEVSAIQLFRDYDANEVDADDKYKGKLLVVDGFADKTSKGLWGEDFL